MYDMLKLTTKTIQSSQMVEGGCEWKGRERRGGGGREGGEGVKRLRSKRAGDPAWRPAIDRQLPSVLDGASCSRAPPPPTPPRSQVSCMNPTAGSMQINPRLQRNFALFAIGLPGPMSLMTIYQTFLDGHLKR